MALTDNLEAYWNLSEASGTRNDSHSTNHLTDNNTVATGTGPDSGTCADFESGNFERLTRADNAALSCGDTDFTINLWVNLESIAANQMVANKGSADGGGNSEWRIQTGGAAQPFTFDVWTGTSPTTVTNTNGGAPSTATWYMLTVWHDATNNQIGIARNAGTADTAAYSGGVNDGTSPLEFGGSISAFTFYDGLMAYAGFWRRVLTSGERTTLYNSGAGLAYASLGGGGSTLARQRLVNGGLVRGRLRG